MHHCSGRGDKGPTSRKIPCHPEKSFLPSQTSSASQIPVVVGPESSLLLVWMPNYYAHDPSPLCSPSIHLNLTHLHPSSPCTLSTSPLLTSALPLHSSSTPIILRAMLGYWAILTVPLSKCQVLTRRVKGAKTSPRYQNGSPTHHSSV
jgi:hypothetical protein